MVTGKQLHLQPNSGFKPHPGNIVKQYAMKQVFEELKEAGLLK